MTEKLQPSTKQKLAAIVNGFDDFDSEMKIGTRQRRETDEFKIADLKNTMTRLDSELIVEIKRRTEMNKSTQMWFEQSLAATDKGFKKILTERTDVSTKRLDELSDRIAELNKRRIQDKEDILKQVADTALEMRAMLSEFKAEFDIDKEQRVLRENEMIKQLTDHEQLVSSQYENQILLRESRYQAVRGVLDANIKLREKADQRFQSFFEREIHLLHNNVKLESDTREREDDEIVEALNRYTVKLQNSLQIINSTEM